MTIARDIEPIVGADIKGGVGSRRYVIDKLSSQPRRASWRKHPELRSIEQRESGPSANP